MIGKIRKVDNQFILQLAEPGEGRFASTLPAALVLGDFDYISSKDRELVQGLSDNSSIVRLGLENKTDKQVKRVMQGICRTSTRHTRKSRLRQANEAIRTLDFGEGIEPQSMCDAVRHLAQEKHAVVTEIGLGSGLNCQTAEMVMEAISDNPFINCLAVHGGIDPEVLTTLLANLPEHIVALELADWDGLTEESLALVATAFNTNPCLQVLRFNGQVIEGVLKYFLGREMKIPGLSYVIVGDQLDESYADLARQYLNEQNRVVNINEIAFCEPVLEAVEQVLLPAAEDDVQVDIVYQDDLIGFVNKCRKAVNLAGSVSKSDQQVYDNLQGALAEQAGSEDGQLRVLSHYFRQGKGSYHSEGLNGRLAVMLNRYYGFGLQFNFPSDVRDLKDSLADQLQGCVQAPPVMVARGVGLV